MSCSHKNKLWGLFTVCSYNSEVALFPGSPCAQTKDRKEREEPSRIYHVRNVIGRDNLITVSGRINKIAMMLYSTHSVVKAL